MEVRGAGFVEKTMCPSTFIHSKIVCESLSTDVNIIAQIRAAESIDF